MKIGEYELNDKLKEFDLKSITVYFNELLHAKIKMNGVKINYNIKNGYLNIKDEINNNISINIASAYNIQAKAKEISIKLDNGINIRIEQN